MKQVFRMGVTLMIVGLVAAAGLGLTYSLTRQKIDAYDLEIEAKAAVAALPGVDSVDELEEEPGLLKKAKKVEGVEKVFSAEEGYIFKIETKGYGGPLVLAIGVDLQGQIAGISVVSSRETVGLGTVVLAEENTKQYNGKNLEDPLEVGNDIQAVTGATITSRAVADQARKALEAFKAIKQ